jgi:hypothetical protein
MFYYERNNSHSAAATVLLEPGTKRETERGMWSNQEQKGT